MSQQDAVRDVVVIGAGLAGLTAAYELKRHGIDALILERESDVGASWSRRHPQLTLNTHRSLSALPGLKYPAGTGAFPRRGAVIAHLQGFRDTHGFEIRHGVEALSASRTDATFLIETNAGAIWARNLIVATGRDAVSTLPEWKGLETFGGRILHAADFGDARAYAGKSVLVIGGGNSGFDILNHLSRVETGQIWLSLRRSPGLMPKRLGGFAVHRLSPIMAMLPVRLVDLLVSWTQRLAFGDLSRYGFPKSPADAATRLTRNKIAIAVDDGAIAAVKQARISVVPAVAEFFPSAVLLSDGRSLQPDVVIAAVGYSSGLAPLLGPLGALDENGQARMRGELGATAVPNLWLVGMKPSLTSYFLQARREAKAVAASVASARSA